MKAKSDVFLTLPVSFYPPIAAWHVLCTPAETHNTHTLPHIMSLGRAWREGRVLHTAIAVGVGVASGTWLFGEPVRRYFESEAGRQAVARREDK